MSTSTSLAFLAIGVRRYCDLIGSPSPDFDFSSVRLDPSVGQQISDLYMSAKPWYDEAVSAYHALRRETTLQFQFLVGGPERGGLGVTVEIVDHDPYADATVMAEDLKDRRLKIYSSKVTGNPHPFLSYQENDMFRALYDAFGHAASGSGFDRDGEEAAWLSQWRLYSPLARLALATETRGQSCAQSFFLGGKKFPEQKLMLLPRQFTEPASGATIRPSR